MSIDDFYSRAIYDGHEHQKFMEKLDERVKTHDKDIERMCNHHYQGFIDSIRELLQVRSQAQELNVSNSPTIIHGIILNVLG